MTQIAHLAEARTLTPWQGTVAPRVSRTAPQVDGATGPVVLLIDDDVGYRSGLGDYLRANGFAVAECESYAEGLALMDNAAGPFVVVSELTVESRHLFDCLSQFRRGENGSVLVLSGRGDETETIVALELGADDVIAKTTDRREILARTRAAVRRLRELQPDAVLPAPLPGGGAGSSWRFLSKQRRLLDPQGQPVPLTHAEFSLLAAFVANAGKELSREQLSVRVLGRQLGRADRGIDNLVVKLRRKLRDTAQLGQMIRTVRPRGYVFTGWQISAE